MLRSEDIVEAVLAYNPVADTEMLRGAYVFTAKVHKGQTRLSGEAYLSHPMDVAGILTSLELDVPTISAGLLHDTVEDTHTTEEEIREFFGEEVASLVDGMTKISRIEFHSQEDQQAENIRKMILAMVNDIRVILIKLADRLHNLRTLEYLPKAKQVRIAQETFDIYVPIAHRLGLGLIHRELQELCLKFLNPKVYEEISAKVPEKELEVDRSAAEISALIQEKLKDLNIEATVERRPTSYYGIYRKMVSRNMSVERFFDVIRIRVLTKRRIDCYTLLGVIHALWKPVPGKLRDFIGVPKTNQYQSLHTLVLGHKGHPIKIQILTDKMQRLADRGITAQWKYKERPQESHQQRAERLFWLNSLLRSERELLDSREFLTSVKKDLFPEVVYVFTPKGEVRELLKGSTPIDFAFNIHTEVGMKTSGCRVNGRLVALDFTLRNGDAVEIQTSPERFPEREWLRFAKTPKARTRIKEWLRAKERERSIEFGKALLTETFKKYHVETDLLEAESRFQELIQKLGHHDREKFLENVGYGKISPLLAVEKLLPGREFRRLKKKEEALRDKDPLEGSATGIKVTGMDDIFIHLASCCKPIPGDRIIAFIGDKRGVSVHEIECPLVSDLDVNPERRIEVAWDPSAKVARFVKVRVLAMDKPGVLADICSAITAHECNIGRTQAVTAGDKSARCDFEIEVFDKDQLEETLAAIRKTEAVLSVERLKGVESPNLPMV